MRWVEPQAVDVPAALTEAVGGHPLVAQTLVRRGFADVDRALAFLDPARYTPAPPEQLPGLNRAARRLETAVEAGQPICVWGDFDVDGQTATALLVQTLTELGARVGHHIPVRQTESHGLNLPALQAQLEAGIGVLLTCDTGIGEHEAIAHAQAHGVDVLVTDHHTLPPQLPQAHALVNPQMLNKTHPLRTLPGVGVAYKLAEALYARAGRPGDVEKHLDLVALGIVADIAVQRGDTRYLLQRGLAALRRTPRPGLQALIKNAELDPTWLGTEQIAFGLAPRLNALGRLSDANTAVTLLTSNDPQIVSPIATQLEGLNAQRKLMCDQVFAAAMALLEHDPGRLKSAALVLANPSWPPGVIGIVASRLVEHLNRPTVLIANPPGQLARGSARSVEGVNISEAIASQAALLESHGGHPMAAGMVLRPERIEAFTQGLGRALEAAGGVPDEAPALRLDGTLGLEEISLELVADLERLAPFGAGNPPLVLASRALAVANPRKMGRNLEHRQVVVRDAAGNVQRVVWWRGSEWALPKGHFDLAYTLQASTFQGRREVQIAWVDARALPDEDGNRPNVLQTVSVVDLRGAADARARLKALQAATALQVWGEGPAELELLVRARHELSPTKALAVWTAPPHPEVLLRALERVRPQTVLVVGLNPQMDELEPFLRRLAGLVKFALQQRAGQAHTSRLAAATAQTEAVARLGAAWLVAKGWFAVEERDDALAFSQGDGRARPNLDEATQRLQRALAETAAYRDHFHTAEKDRLVDGYGVAEPNTSTSSSG